MFSIFRGFNAITLKEFTSVLRDPMTLFFMLFPPLVEMIAFGFALDNDVKYMATVVYNEDKTLESRKLLDMFVNTETFRISREVGSVEELVAEIRKKARRMWAYRYRQTSLAICIRNEEHRCRC